MHVAVCKLTLRLPENQSLKGKRRVLGSLSTRVRNRFNVAVAEVGSNGAWQLATLGISSVSNSAAHASQVVDGAVAFIEASGEPIEVLERHQETLSGF